MNERSPIPLLIYTLKINDQRARIVLRVREDLRAEERRNMVSYHIARLRLEVRVVDPEAVVEPVHLVLHQLSRDEAL